MKNNCQLSRRRHDSEIMDDPSLDPLLLQETLQDLERLNRFTLAYWPIRVSLKRFLDKEASGIHWSILDLGSGYGDTLRDIGDFARKHSYRVSLTGIDCNPAAVECARAAAAYEDIKFISGDICRLDGEHKADIIITSLVMHHLRDEEIVRVLRWMTSTARRGWIISDLHRHWICRLAAALIPRWLDCNHVILADGKLSVERSFTRKEWVGFLSAAGIDPAQVKIEWFPNFRYVLTYEHT